MPPPHPWNRPQKKLSRCIGYLAAADGEACAPLDRQYDMIEHDAAAHDARIVVTCVDVLERAWVPPLKRAGLKEALDSLEVHDAGVLLVAHKDRLGISTFEQALVMQLVRDRGAQVHAVCGGLSTCRAERATIIDLMNVLDEYQRQILRQRDDADLAFLRRCQGWPLNPSDQGPRGCEKESG